MDTLTSIRENIQWGNQVIEMTMADVTSEIAHWVPAGIAHPVSALYVHAVVAQDVVVNVLIKGGAPLMATEWAGKTGCSDPQFGLNSARARVITVDLPTFRDYAQAVYKATDEQVASLSPTDLDQTRDLSQQGIGVRSIGWMLNALVAGHMHNLAGEISAIKGTQGLKGYPF